MYIIENVIFYNIVFKYKKKNKNVYWNPTVIFVS